MLSKINKSNSEGFTIIEVMIVLAVAALILLIVLLAVPALTRSSRNTALKSDVSTVTGGISTYESDNNGDVPTTLTGTGTVAISGGGGTAESVTIQGGTSVATEAAPASPAQATPPTIGSGAGKIDPGQIEVYPQSTCPGNSESPSAQTFAIFYVLQTSGSGVVECVGA